MGVTLPDPEAAVDVRLEYLEDRVSLDKCKCTLSNAICMHPLSSLSLAQFDYYCCAPKCLTLDLN